MAADILEINQQLFRSRSVRRLSLVEMLSEHSSQRATKMAFSLPGSSFPQISVSHRMINVSFCERVQVGDMTQWDPFDPHKQRRQSQRRLFTLLRYDFLTYLRVFRLWCSGATFTVVCWFDVFKCAKRETTHFPKHSGQESQITEISTQRAAQRAFSQLFPNIIFSSRVRM